MKKFKSIVLALILLVLVFALVGCGKNNKIVASKTMEEDGQNIETTIEINIEKDIAQEAKMTMKFEDEETAESFAEFMEEEGKVEQDGKTIVITGTVEDMIGEEKEMTRDEMIEFLEEEGFTIK